MRLGEMRSAARGDATVGVLGTVEVPLRPAVKGVPAISIAHWLVLALVIEKPSYGYEIGERYDRRFGFFLPLRRTAIYSALDRLEQVGLIEVRPLAAGSMAGLRRVRVTYGPTDDAARAHERWLSSPVNYDRWRHDLLARIGTAHLHGSAIMCELLASYVRHAEMQEHRIQTLIEERAAVPCESLQALSATLLLREQQSVVAAQLDWVRGARDALSHGGARSA